MYLFIKGCGCGLVLIFYGSQRSLCIEVATSALSFSNVLVLLLHISDRTETPHTLSTKIHSNKSEPNDSLKYSPIQNEAKRDKSGGERKTHYLMKSFCSTGLNRGSRMILFNIGLGHLGPLTDKGSLFIGEKGN